MKQLATNPIVNSEPIYDPDGISYVDHIGQHVRGYITARTEVADERILIKYVGVEKVSQYNPLEPEIRHMVGSRLVYRVLEDANNDPRIKYVELVADHDGLVPFYTKFGFKLGDFNRMSYGPIK